ncbi:hypothetical protein QBC34DRAFT_479925 [Podospora aff. communis PSN243]|uniref:Uncharacterized protein n=1 Tax=Podospora aff. communis PSN243 TaxID=3040156 RepID=A0AAV9G3P7_9PEZI|nr:hypothetical protein QBC34DRAFT_479925 [Podospora aff. communis PSN243]
MWSGSDRDANDTSDADSDAESVESPVYTSDELISLLDDYFDFLSGLHFDPDLLTPADATSSRDINITLENLSDSDVSSTLELNAFTRDLLYRLPRFTHAGSTNADFDHKSNLIDWTQYHPGWFDPARLEYLIPLSLPYEDGDTILLDALRGDIIRILGSEGGGAAGAGAAGAGGRAATPPPPPPDYDSDYDSDDSDDSDYDAIKFRDICDYIKKRKFQLRKLVHIPCPGRETMEIDHSLGKPEGEVTEEQVFAQEIKAWGTDLDFRYMRQVYREHGWPEEFEREECWEFIEGFLARMEEDGRREVWRRVDDAWYFGGDKDKALRDYYSALDNR